MLTLKWSQFKQLLQNDSGSVFKELIYDNNYNLFMVDGALVLCCSISKDTVAQVGSDQKDYEDNFRSRKANVISSNAPFAKPDYRTKHDASTWSSVAESASQPNDFLLTEERFVSGGEIIYTEIKEGDYITAEVYDKDNVIPEPYRAVICESHPSVAKYVIKKFLKPTASGEYGSYKLDTYPLNARITTGLYLRLTLHTSSETGTRKFTVNYHLTKKLV